MLGPGIEIFNIQTQKRVKTFSSRAVDTRDWSWVLDIKYPGPTTCINMIHSHVIYYYKNIQKFEKMIYGMTMAISAVGLAKYTSQGVETQRVKWYVFMHKI